MMLENYRLPLIAAAAALFFAGSASATYGWNPKPPAPDECVVKAFARGNSWNNDEFWKVKFDEAVCSDAYIKEICIDLLAGTDTNAFFDLSGGSASNSAFGPKLGWLSGVDASDVTFSPHNGDSSKIVVTFADGAFGVGDYITFGTDIDHLGGNYGDDVGNKAVGFAVTFGDGLTYETSFAKYSSTRSRATIKADDCCGDPVTVIPTPSAVGLGMLMLGGVAVRRRRSA